MDEALIKELENLRAENDILRASLEEVHRDKTNQESSSMDVLLKEFTSKLSQGLEQLKTQLKEPSSKTVNKIEEQMAENPIPLLLTAFGIGYLISRLLDRR